MTQLIKVFYVGPKPEKRDNVNRTNGARGRIWRGFGSSIDVPADEAAVLATFEDVWCFEDALPKHQAAREALDEQAASDAQRIKEREEAAIAEQARIAALSASQKGTKTEAQDDNSEDVDREALLKGAILSLDPASEKDYTKSKPQKPRVDRIIEITSASFSAQEITVAFQELVASGQVKLPE